MSDVLIGAAFESRLKAWAASKTPPIPVAYENVSFKPPALARYIAAYLLPANTGSDMLDGGDRIYNGIFQASIVLPANVGAAAARALVPELDAIFPISFEYNGLTINILSPMSAAPGITDTDGYTLPVSCRYRVDAV